MKFLLAAFLKTLVLLVSTGIVFLLADHVFDYASYYEAYQQEHPNQTITIGNAMGFVDDGEIADSASLTKSIFGEKSQIIVPNIVIDLLNIQLGYQMTKFFLLYVLIGAISGLLCLILGIGQPFAWLRGFDLLEKIDDKFIDRNYVYRSRYDGSESYVGEKRAMIVWFILLIPILLVTALYGAFIIPIILFDIAVFILIVLAKTVSFVSSYPISAISLKLKQRDGKPIEYLKRVKSGVFIIENCQEPDEVMYFNEYWNAVVAERIMKCDLKGETFRSKDAEETIVYGDEKMHSRFELKKLLNELFSFFNKKKREALIETERAMQGGNYHSEYSDGYYSICLSHKTQEGEYAGYSYSHGCIKVKNATNALFMLIILLKDKENKVFESSDWNSWAKSDKQKYSHLLYR